MRKSVWLLLIGLFVSLGLLGCGGGGGPAPTVSLPRETAERIVQTSQQINEIFNQNYDPADPEGSLTQTVEQVKSYPQVEATATIPDGIIVKYRDGGYQIWSGDVPRLQEQPSRSAILSQIEISREYVGNRKAAIINCFALDPGMEGIKFCTQIVKDILEAAGYQVSLIQDSQANFNFFAKDIANYGAVFYWGHGGATWLELPDPFEAISGADFLVRAVIIQTGIKIPSDSNSHAQQLQQYYSLWKEGWIMPMKIPWGNGDDKERRRNSIWFWGLTQKFFDYQFSQSNTRFPHTLFYNGACYSLRFASLGAILNRYGVAAYLGWTGEQKTSPITAIELTNKMVNGQNLQTAYDNLPDNLKYDSETRAKCEYYPDSAGTIELNRGTIHSSLWTELTWDTNYTDIDLHLVPRYGQSFSENDCYFSNRNPSWGAELDYDDVDGYGPEHITGVDIEPDQYKLFVHFWDKHGYEGISHPRVKMRVNGQEYAFGPVSFSVDYQNSDTGGHTWDVCYISFPSGRVEPINNVYIAESPRSRFSFPSKGH